MKRLLSLCMIVILTCSLTACAGSGDNNAGKETGTKDTEADKGLPVMGDQITYDPNHLVNDGNPITIDWWVWASEEMFRSIADAYEEIHPNVAINIINNPWDGYFTKLPLSLQKGEEGPTLFNIHNSYENLLMNYIEPYDIDTKEFIADYPSAASHVKDGKIYYADYGMSTAWYITTKSSGKRQGLQKRTFRLPGRNS